MTGRPRPEIDLMTDRAHSARIYDYFLGGKTNYAADRAVGDAVIGIAPGIRNVARANRAFMHRTTHLLADHHGIRQFLDIGAGIPTPPNLHEIAQGIAPESRIVYVDNDPIVLAHARALMVGDPRGRTAYVEADVRRPRTILEAPELVETFDRSRPIALSLFAVLHFIDDDEVAYGAVRQLVDALAPGSFVSLTSATSDFYGENAEEGLAAYRDGGVNVKPRSRAEIERFLSGLELLEPGLAMVHEWRGGTDLGTARSPDENVVLYAAVARKP
ncbi:SAM-dependent methyltransferase [Actinomycetes bacterium KLBMP 9759]